MAGQRFLLDTNILLAALIAPETLPAATQEMLRDPTNDPMFSAASLWEIAIKSSLGRNDFDFRSEDIQLLAEQTGFVELPILSRHCHGVTDLPWHHRDPFDRLLVAQAMLESVLLLTRDRVLVPYSNLVSLIRC